MPLTRFIYPYSYDTVFLPTVSTSNNLNISGNSSVSGTLTVMGSSIINSLFATTVTLNGSINATIAAENSRSLHTFQNTNGSVFSIRSHGPSYVETLFGNTLAGKTLLTTTTGDLIIGAFPANNLILGTNNAERIRIDSAGNVGIGTNAPGRKLDVFNSGTATTELMVRNGTVSLQSYVDSAFGVIGTSTNHVLQIQTNGTSRMTFGANGGITTSNSFTVSSNSNVSLGTDSGGSISIGRTDGTATSPYIDFNSGATALDYDTRMQASGGIGTVGKGNFSIESGSLKFLSGLIEPVNVVGSAATGTINYDVLTNRNVLYYTSNSSANWTLNVRGNGSNTLNSMLAVGESITVVFMATNGSTAYYATGFQVDGTATTVRWQGGTAPTSGNASSTDVYSYTIVKTAATPTYFVLGTQTRFA